MSLLFIIVFLDLNVIDAQLVCVQVQCLLTEKKKNQVKRNKKIHESKLSLGVWHGLHLDALLPKSNVKTEGERGMKSGKDFYHVIKVNIISFIKLLLYTLDMMLWKWHFTSVLLPKSCNSSLIMKKKKSDKSQLRDIL